MMKPTHLVSAKFKNGAFKVDKIKKMTNQNFQRPSFSSNAILKLISSANFLSM